MSLKNPTRILEKNKNNVWISPGNLTGISASINSTTTPKIPSGILNIHPEIFMSSSSRIHPGTLTTIILPKAFHRLLLDFLGDFSEEYLNIGYLKILDGNSYI